MKAHSSTQNKRYLEALKRTQGAWVGEAWNVLRKKRRRIELAASRKRVVL